MPPITVNWSDLEIAFERNSPDQESFLDLENGDLLSIVDGEPDAAARRAKVSGSPERYLRVDPGVVARAVPLDGALRRLGRGPAAARAPAHRHRRQGRVPPLQGRAARVPGRARALVRVPLGAAALPHPDLDRSHEDRGREPAAVGPRRAAGRARGDPAHARLGRGARARSCAARRASSSTRSRRPSCRRRSRSSSSCAIAARASCCAAAPASTTTTRASSATFSGRAPAVRIAWPVQPSAVATSAGSAAGGGVQIQPPASRPSCAAGAVHASRAHR